MTLVLIPIPIHLLGETEHRWAPYVLSIAERHRLDPRAMRDMLFRGEVQAFLIWDSEAEQVKAFIGVRYMERANRERVAEIIWLTGEDRKAWVHLWDVLEGYLREQESCVSVKAIARKGWKPHLEGNGFRITHMIFEKELAP